MRQITELGIEERTPISRIIDMHFNYHPNYRFRMKKNAFYKSYRKGSITKDTFTTAYISYTAIRNDMIRSIRHNQGI